MQPWKISVQIMSFKLSLISSHSKRKKKWVEINSSDIEIFYYSENSLESHVMKHIESHNPPWWIISNKLILTENVMLTHS